jgi:hypothetical protein
LFNDANENPGTSPNFLSSQVDDVTIVGSLLTDVKSRSHEKLALAVLRALKIVSRKVVSRSVYPKAVISMVLSVLRAPKTSRIAREASSVILNLCYERHHVEQVVAEGGVPLLTAFLMGDDPELQAAAAGALQSIVRRSARSFRRL